MTVKILFSNAGSETNTVLYEKPSISIFLPLFTQLISGNELSRCLLYNLHLIRQKPTKTLQNSMKYYNFV